MIKCHQDCLGNDNPDRECMTTMFVRFIGHTCLKTAVKWETVEESNIWFCNMKTCKNYLLVKERHISLPARGTCLLTDITRNELGVCQEYEKHDKML